MKDQDLTKYNDLKQHIYDVVNFCARQEIERIETHIFPKAGTAARKKWKEHTFDYMRDVIAEFKAESLRLFGEEYSIMGIYSRAIYDAYRECKHTRQ